MEHSAGLQPFRTFASVAVPIDIANCGTDQIIPARFLRRAKTYPDYPRFLFHDRRFNEDGSEKDFILDRPPYHGAGIIVADINWGCGSSRENAVTALEANGVRAIVAPSFGDIHYNNCIKNCVLPVRLSASDCEALRDQLHASPGAEIAIDLGRQNLTGPDQTAYDFDIDPFDKHRLLNGLDDIALTMEFDQDISGFVERYKDLHRWAF